MPSATIDAWDQRTQLWARTGLGAGSIAPLRIVTQLGSTEVIVATATAVGLGAAVWRRSWRPAVALAVTIGGQNLAFNLVKRIARRTRPPGPHHASWAGASFPSGHTAAAASAWPAMLAVGAPGAGAAAKAASYAAGPAVGATRVLLGVHWLSDVIAGLALGWGWLALTRRLRIVPAN